MMECDLLLLMDIYMCVMVLLLDMYICKLCAFELIMLCYVAAKILKNLSNFGHV